MRNLFFVVMFTSINATAIANPIPNDKGLDHAITSSDKNTLKGMSVKIGQKSHDAIIRQLAYDLCGEVDTVKKKNNAQAQKAFDGRILHAIDQIYGTHYCGERNKGAPCNQAVDYRTPELISKMAVFWNMHENKFLCNPQGGTHGYIHLYSYIIRREREDEVIEEYLLGQGKNPFNIDLNEGFDKMCYNAKVVKGTTCRADSMKGLAPELRAKIDKESCNCVGSRTHKISIKELVLLSRKYQKAIMEHQDTIRSDPKTTAYGYALRRRVSLNAMRRIFRKAEKAYEERSTAERVGDKNLRF